MKRFNDDYSISDLMKIFIKENKLEKGLDELRIKDIWIQTLGSHMTNYTKDIKLIKQTLYVELTSSVLRQELLLGKEKIIKSINEQVGKELIKDLVMR